MSTDQRHDLETNDLYQGLQKFSAALMSGSNSIMTGLAVIVLVVVLIVAYSFYSSASLNATSALWREMSQADQATLEKIAKQDAGTPAGKIARFHLARAGLNRDGLPMLSLPDPEKRNKAIEAVEQARSAYEKLVRDSRGDPTLHRESLYMQAQAEQALIGIPRNDDPTKWRGNLDKVIELMSQLVKTAKESYQGQEAQRFLDQVDKDRDAVEAFYVQLNKSFASAAATPPPSLPGLPFLPPEPTAVPKVDEPKAEPKSEPKPKEEPKPEQPKEAPKPEPKAEPKEAPKAEPKAEPKPKEEPKAETKASESK